MGAKQLTDVAAFTELWARLAEVVGTFRTFAGSRSSYFKGGAVTPAEAGPISRTQDYAELCRLWEERKAHYLVHRQERSCPCCGDSESEPLFVSQDGHPYLRCAHCSMWYVSPYVPDSVWSRYQQEEAAVATLHDRQFAYNCSEERYQADRLRFSSYFDTIRPLVSGQSLAGCVYLDVGCLTGSSLKVAASYGMEVYGTEGSPRALHHVKETPMGDRVHQDLESLATALNGKKADCVSLWESLEHDPGPLETLRRARRLMRAGGLVALTVPNMRSALPLLLREYCFYCFGGADVQGHLNLFSIDTLTALLDRAGFRRVFDETLYSTDWRQLVYYLVDQRDKIYCHKNLVTGSCASVEIPGWIQHFSNAVGPELSKLEKTLKAGPMIFLVAAAA